MSTNCVSRSITTIPLREGKEEKEPTNLFDVVIFSIDLLQKEVATIRAVFSLFSLSFYILLVHMLRLTNAITAIGRRRSIVTTTTITKNNKSFPSTMSFHFASSDYAKSFQGLPTPDIPKLKKSATDYLDKFDKQSWYTDPVSVSLFVCLFVCLLFFQPPLSFFFYKVLTNTHASIFFSFLCRCCRLCLC
jgi:hypothetical protein